jgi:PAS domain S-box-containing protein
MATRGPLDTYDGTNPFRSHDWAHTPLGSPEEWPRDLTVLVKLMLASGQPELIVWGPQRVVLYNAAFAALLGEQESLLGRSMSNRVLPAEGEPGLPGELLRLVESCFSGHTTTTLDRDFISFPHPHIRGKRPIPVGVSCTPIAPDSQTGGDGESVAGVFCVCQPSPTAGFAERALMESNQRLELAWEAVRGAIYEHSVELGETTYHAEHWAEILGYRPGELPPPDRFFEWLYAQVHPDDRGRFDRANEDFVEGRTKTHQVEGRICHKDGHWIWVRGVSKAVERNDDDTVRRLVGLMLDITESKEAEEAITASLSEQRRHREFLESLIQSSPIAIAVVQGTEMRLTLVNATFRTIAPAGGEIVGKTLAEVFPRAAEHVCPLLRKVIASGRRWKVPEIKTPLGDRPVTWWQGEVLPLPREGGQEPSALILTWEITERKTAEEALRESEARFRVMADGLPLLVWVHDASGAQQIVNETYCEFFGVTREEMKGTRWQMLVHPEDIEAYSREFIACMRDRRPFHAEVRVKRADGEYRWLESWGRPRITPTGKFKGFVGASADITSRKEAEEALRESEERFRTLADNISQLAWMADGDGEVSWFNKRWFDYTGTSLDEVKGWGWTKAHHPDHVERVTKKIRRCFEKGEPWEDTFLLKSQSGEYRWFLARAVPIRDESGEIVRWFGTNTDITDQREAEEALREGDRRKDQFLAMLGHELRNPLAAIQNAAEIFKHIQTDDPKMKRLQGVLQRQTSHMSSLIDGLLEVSRVARGKISLDKRTIDLVPVVEGVVHDREPQATSRGLEIRKDLPLEPIWVSGDPVRLAQVFDNLMGNAIKFTNPPGTITVTLQEEGDRAIARVEDTGVGIRKEMLSQIFEPFQQETQDMARGAGGLGLGLALAKGLVDLHGGTIEAHSEGPQTGSELVVRLPLAGSPRTIRPARRGAQASPQRVLIVEDNEDTAQTMSDLLRLHGHEVSTAETGPEALEILKDHPVDIAFCDLGLPGMSGYELAELIRKDSALRGIALVALTGYGQPEDIKRSLEAGFDEHMTKPVDLDTLDDIIARLTHTRTPSAPSS